MIEALILDFDGLILDTETPFRSSWEELSREYGLAGSEAAWAGLLGSSADPPEAYALLERHLERPVDRTALRQRRLARELELLKHERVLPGVRELIEDAEASGVRLAIASSSECEWVTGHLRAVNLLDRFESITCAEHVAATKPAPDLYHRALGTLGLTADRAMAFEDSVHGVAAAKGAGLYCVAVPNRVTQYAQFPRADRVVDSLAGHALKEFIESADAHYRKQR